MVYPICFCKNKHKKIPCKIWPEEIKDLFFGLKTQKKTSFNRYSGPLSPLLYQPLIYNQSPLTLEHRPLERHCLKGL